MKKSALNNSAASTVETEISQLGSHIYDELVKSIREGRYTPGEHIRETVVATELGVSRTPVREALRRLHNDGTVVLTPRKGAVVAELAHQEVVELYMLRQEMEATAARFAAQHASDIEILQIDNILKRSEELLHDRHRLNQVNWEFHNAIYEATHNRYFMKAIRAISDSMVMLRGARYIPEDRPEQLASEHRAIFNAIQNRSPQEAAEAARYHIQQSLLVHLNSNNRSFSQNTSKN
ncbi:GntR family transcriptional regulator [Paenochrobactrum pullorum]|uniref:GntR family transcriptional regulator n=1 Tax=Paenochrobactrum pullorum TaxID=1324351 RepID=UPI0035BBE685